MEYQIVKWLHILSSTFLFGTGIGSAFYLFFVNRARDPRAIAVLIRYVVLADWLFTIPTIVFQPLSGIYLVRQAGFPWQSAWLVWSVVLYFLAGACWLLVVWLQLRMRDMAQEALRTGSEIPQRYWRYHRRWTKLGIPAFVSLVIVFYLMVAKPA